MRVLAVDGSPNGGGRTASVLAAVLSGAEESGAQTELLGLASEQDIETALRACERNDAFVLGSPTYRASFAAPLKGFLDRLPRGMWGETEAPITGRPVAVVATGATWHHFLGLRDLREILAVFFAAHVLPPGMYVPHEGFDDAGMLLPDYAALAALTGRALVELGSSLDRSPALRALGPQA